MQLPVVELYVPLLQVLQVFRVVSSVPEEQVEARDDG